MTDQQLESREARLNAARLRARQAFLDAYEAAMASLVLAHPSFPLPFFSEIEAFADRVFGEGPSRVEEWHVPVSSYPTRDALEAALAAGVRA